MMLMLGLFACLAGVFILLVISEYLGHKKRLRGELQRKFTHLTVGSFIAFWPWLVSWQTITWIGVAMLLVVLFNRRKKLVDFYSNISRDRDSYGDVFFALAVILAPLMTQQEVFFAIAMLIMAIGDSLANLAGRKYGRNWTYMVFHQTKSVVGSMTMWVVSFSILAVGILLFANSQINLPAYTALILLLPPALVITENAVLGGMDNLTIPAVALLALHLAM